MRSAFAADCVIAGVLTGAAANAPCAVTVNSSAASRADEVGRFMFSPGGGYFRYGVMCGHMPIFQDDSREVGNALSLSTLPAARHKLYRVAYGEAPRPPLDRKQ